MAQIFETQTAADRANALYTSRIVRNIVKKVEGVAFIIEGKDEPQEIQFDEYGEMDLVFYTCFMRMLNSKPEILTQINSYYGQSISLKGVEEVKKKKSKTEE